MGRVPTETIKGNRVKAFDALPDRLKRLNRELAIERSKDFDYLYAVRGEHRFKIAVFRNGGNGFAATCKAAGYVRRYEASIPSEAFRKLTLGLDYLVRQMEQQKAEAEYQMRNQAKKKPLRQLALRQFKSPNGKDISYQVLDARGQAVFAWHADREISNEPVFLRQTGNGIVRCCRDMAEAIAIPEIKLEETYAWDFL